MGILRSDRIHFFERSILKEINRIQGHRNGTQNEVHKLPNVIIKV